MARNKKAKSPGHGPSITQPLGKQSATLKTGNERLTLDGQPTDFSLFQFWQWSVSDLLSNATRGRFAEFIVAAATGADLSQIRNEWSAFDLQTPEGVKLEIKSAAFLQSWEQAKTSVISFSTKAARLRAPETRKRAETGVRSADVYVFCLLDHLDKATVDPLNLNQWKFYVLVTRQLNDYTRSQHSITLASLARLTNPVGFHELREEIRNKDGLNSGHL